MGWFEHQHSWYPNISTFFTIMPPGVAARDGKACLFPQQCRCGAVRTVEIAQGEAPIIRMGREEAPKE